MEVIPKFEFKWQLSKKEGTEQIDWCMRNNAGDSAYGDGCIRASQRSERTAGGAFGRSGFLSGQRVVVEVEDDGQRKRSGGADVKSWRGSDSCAVGGRSMVGGGYA